MLIIDKKENILSGYNSYLKDESKLSFGDISCLAIPENETELTDFLKQSYSKNLPVTISNGRTGVTGGAIPMKGALLSVERLNNIIGLEKTGAEYILKVQSGVSLAEIDRYLENKELEGEKYFYPVDVTEATARIGGTISTNASGERSFKYGSTRKWLRYLKIALADGTVFSVKRGEIFADGYQLKVPLPGGRLKIIPVPKYRMPAVKNAAGYFAAPGMDLIDLIAGSEGTLGVILEAGIALAKKPESIVTILAFFKTEKDAMEFFLSAKKAIPSAAVFEYFDKGAIDILRHKFPELPAGRASAIFLEIEVEGDSFDAAAVELDRLLQSHNCLSGDTWTGFEKKDAEKIRAVRHGVPETINEILAERKRKFPDIFKISADIAVPEDRFQEMVSYYKSKVEPAGIQYTMFGHIGESHLHMNILPGNIAEFIKAQELHADFAKKAVAMGGTVSAEHGIGKIKHKYLEIMYGEEGLRQMAEVKRVFDEKCLLNRGNIIPEKYLTA